MGEGRAEVVIGPGLDGAGGGWSIAYEVMVPGVVADRLGAQLGGTVTLHTVELLEGQGQGVTLTPRLIGFGTPEERSFFVLFTTVKGLGSRKALRALRAPVERVARAIAERDTVFLKTLPEIGARLADTIVAELHGKVDGYVGSEATGDEPGGAASAALSGEAAEQAVAALVQLGEPRSHAESLVRRALASSPGLDSADGILAAAFSVRS